MESPLSVFTSDSRCLVSTKRISRDTVVYIVELYHASLEFAGDSVKSCLALCEDVCSKSVDCIIGEPYCLLLCTICYNRKDRTEDLFFPYLHVSCDIAEDSGRKIRSRESYWDAQLCEDIGIMSECVVVLL